MCWAVMAKHKSALAGRYHLNVSQCIIFTQYICQCKRAPYGGSFGLSYFGYLVFKRRLAMACGGASARTTFATATACFSFFTVAHHLPDNQSYDNNNKDTDYNRREVFYYKC